MKIKPFNNIVVGELINEEKESLISLPDSDIGRFIRIKVLEVGELVVNMKPGDLVIANAVFEIIDPKFPKVGFINSRDILGRVEE